MQCLKALLFICILFNPALAEDEGDNLPNIPDWFTQKGLPDTASAQSHTPNETINHFTGKLHYSFTDLVIPGNGGMDLQIQRHYNSIDDPYATLALWSDHLHSPLGIGWSMHMGKVQRGANMCSSTWYSASGNPILELPDGSRHILYEQNDPAPPLRWMSKDFWRAQCVNSHLHVQSPEGITYAMTEPGHASEPANTWHVGRITDRNGNWFAFTYQPLPYGVKVLSQITTSDGRTVTFAYSNEANLTSITDTASGRTWNYSITGGMDGQKFLTEVQRPDGTLWQYTYHTSSPGTGSLSRVKNPAGGTIDYHYDHVDFKAGTPWQGQKSTVISSKTASIGPAHPGTPTAPNTSGTWTWAYSIASAALDSTTEEDNNTVTYNYSIPPANPAAFNTTTVTDPVGSITRHYHIGIRSVPWLPTAVGLFVGHAAPLETSLLGYEFIHISNQWDVVAHNLTSAHYYLHASIINQQHIRRNGTLHSTVKTDFDIWGNPGSIFETANNNATDPGSNTTYTRQTHLSYAINTDKWLLRPVASQTISVDGQSHTTNNQYDDSGNLLQQTIAGVTTSHTYHPTGDIASSLDANGNSTSYNHYYRGTAQEEQQPENITTLRTVSDAGDITSVTNGRGHTTNYSYDALGRITKMTPPIGEAIQVTWTPTSRLVWRGGAAAYASLQDLTLFDGLGRLVRRQVTSPPDALGQTIIGIDWQYDILGRRTFQSYPNSTLGTGYHYDSLNRIIATRHGSAAASDSPAYRIDYTTYGNLRTIHQNTAGQGHIDTFRTFGDPEEQHSIQSLHGEIAGNDLYIETQTDTTRDLLGQPLSVTVGGITRTWSYDSRYFLASRSDPETGTTSYTRDNLGNITSQSIHAPQAPHAEPATHYSYDARNRLVAISYPLSAHTDIPNAPNVSYSYNGNDQLTSVTNGAITRSYTYDAGDKLSLETLNTANGFPGAAQSIHYSYNTQEHLSSITYPSGHTIHYHPDALGRATEISPYVTEIQYHPNGSPAAIRHANGILTAITFNARQWPASLRHGVNANTALVHSLYSYDPSGNLTQIGEYADGSYARLYEYDSLNRLTAEAATDGWRQYGYDGTGNLIWQSSPQGVSQYLYHNDTRLLTAINGSMQRLYQYDKAGNVTADGNHTYGYDRANQLRCTHCGSATETTHHYDGTGQRVQTQAAHDTTEYLHNRQGLLLQSQNPDGSRTEHIYLGRRQVAERSISANAEADTIVHIHTDTSGSPQAATDEGGNLLWKESYRAYGERRHNPLTSQAQRQWFHGKEQDPITGLQYFGARYYDPQVGRFMGIDPADYQDGNFYSFHRYAYGNNNPVMYLDPDGKLPIPLLIIGWTAGGAAVSGGINALTQKLTTGSIQWGGIGGVIDAAGDGVILGPVFGTALQISAANTIKNVASTANARKAAKAIIISKKVQITFGRNENQTYHAFRHMDEAGISRDTVRNTIKSDVIKSLGEIKSGQFNGTANVEGKKIDYSAFKFQDGSVNVSRITTPKE